MLSDDVLILANNVSCRRNSSNLLRKINIFKLLTSGTRLTNTYKEIRSSAEVRITCGIALSPAIAHRERYSPAISLQLAAHFRRTSNFFVIRPFKVKIGDGSSTCLDHKYFSFLKAQSFRGVLFG